MALRKHWKFGFISTLAFVSLAVAACGGGDDDGGSSGGGGGTGSDAKFVADICKAGKTFSDDLTKLLSGSTTDPSKAIEQIAKPFEAFAKAFDKANPPSDLKQWHNDATKSLNEVVKKMKGGDQEEILSALDGDPFPEPPKSASDRMQKVAEKNQDCKDANFTFDGSSN